MVSFTQGVNSPMLEALIGKQSRVNGTWRNEDIGIEKVALSWCLFVDLSELDLDLIKVDL